MKATSLFRRLLGWAKFGQQKNHLHLQGAEFTNLNHQLANNVHQQGTLGGEEHINVVIGEVGAGKKTSGGEPMEKTAVRVVRTRRADWLGYVHNPGSLHLAGPAAQSQNKEAAR